MTLKKLYTRGLIIPSLFSIISTSIAIVFKNTNYESEWLTRESIIFISALCLIIYCLIIYTLFLTIFLNQKVIKSVGIASLLSWFLLPITWISLAVYKTVIHNINYEATKTEELFYLITLNLPFIIGLTWTYILFIKEQKINPSPKSL